MPIDNCKHSFAELAGVVLPRYMAELRNRMAVPCSMADFALDGVGARTLLQRFHLEDDFSGCYVLIEGQRPVYVGISQGVTASGSTFAAPPTSMRALLIGSLRLNALMDLHARVLWPM